MRDYEKGGALTEVTFLVLLSTFQPRHGYSVRQFIAEKTQGRVVLGPGTLYGALDAAAAKGWIALCDEENRKKQYQITPLGRQMVQRELNRLVGLVSCAAGILSDPKSI